MNYTATSNRFSRAVVGLILASVLFLIGAGLFTLHSIWKSGASAIDVVMELSLLPESTEVWAGDTTTHQIRYICATFTSGCENAVLTEQLPNTVSWAQSDVQVVVNSQEVITTTYNEATGLLTFEFTPTLAAATTGYITVTTLVPTATASATIDFQAALDWSNGRDVQTTMQLQLLRRANEELPDAEIVLPETSGINEVLTTTSPISETSAVELVMMGEQAPTELALVPVEDSYVDYYSPTQNFDGQPLSFEIAAPFSADDNGYCPTITKISYIKFDLSAVEFPIAQAELRLSPIDSCDLAKNSDGGLSTSLFTASNEWSESEITWENRPIPSMLLNDGVSFSNSLSQPQLATVDEASLANWLAMYQAQGEKTVTIGFISPLFMGCSAQAAPATKVAFQDRQQSSRAASCGVPAEAPHLYLASADGELHPTISPTAVQLQQNKAETTSSLWVILLTLLGMSVITMIGRQKIGR